MSAIENGRPVSRIVPAPAPLRWLPRWGDRWGRRRQVRRNLKALERQTAAVDDIEHWLGDLVLPDGFVECVHHDPRLCEAEFSISIGERTVSLAFFTLLVWSEIDPRDALQADVLDALSSDEPGPHDFGLAGYAEECWLMRTDPLP